MPSGDAGAVHPNVDLREMGRELAEDALHLARVAYVEFTGEARLPELARDRGELVPPPRRDDDVRAVLHEETRAGLADPRGPAGDEREPALHAPNLSVADTSSWVVPVSSAEWPASATIRRSASGHAR